MAAVKSEQGHWRSHPNFIMLVVGFGIFSDQFLFAVLTPVLPFILTDRLHVPRKDIQAATSASLSAFFITSILSPIFVAYFGRHASQRRFMYLLGLLCLASASILLYFARTFALLITSRVLQGTSGSVVWVIGLGMICDAVGSGRLGQAVGIVWGLAMIGAMAAPAIGGALYRFAGLEGITLVSLVILALDFVLRILVREPDRGYRHSDDSASSIDSDSTVDAADYHASHNADERSSLVQHSAPTLSYSSVEQASSKTQQGSSKTSVLSTLMAKVPILKTFREPVMWTSIAIIMVISIFLSFIDATIPLRLGETLDFDSFDSGLMLLTITGMTTLIGPIAGYLVDRYEPRYLAVAGQIVTALGIALLGLPLPEDRAARIAVFAVFLSILGLGLATLDSPAFVASAKLVEDLFENEPEGFDEDPPWVEHQAILYTFFSIGMVLGPTIAAGLSKVLPFWAIAEILAGLSLTMGGLAFAYLR